jgi:hypothetical protein
MEGEKSRNACKQEIVQSQDEENRMAQLGEVWACSEMSQQLHGEEIHRHGTAQQLHYFT